MVQVFAPKADKWDDINGIWVTLHNGKQYMLPPVQRHDKMRPIFNEDGTVGIEVVHADSELANLVGKFVEMIMGVRQNDYLAPVTVYSGLLALVRKLLSKNYAFSEEELRELLTLTKDQLDKLMSIILVHCTRS